LITRSILDNYLLEKAGETGIEIKMGEKVLEYQEKNDYVEVFTDDDTYKAKFIIIAEGSQGKLKHQIRRKDRKDEYAIGVVAEIEEDNESIDRYIHNAIDLHFGRFKHGYGWIFPHEKYYSVGIAGLAKHLPHPKKAMLDFLNENNFNNKYKLHGHIIPAGGVKRRITSSRVILSGDSAGFVDSFIGEGIAYAIRSGQIAVEVISKIILDNGDLESLEKYQIICSSEFIGNLNYSLIFTKLINSYPSIFLKILVSNEAIEKYLEVTTMEISYKSYIKWLIPRIPMFFLRS
ncbi:MAG: tryptophan 7-halogenase, partial [Bacteroidetes bacterium]|nr:tryptophan 7-halogenase [Bacteroidota bacterium]